MSDLRSAARALRVGSPVVVDVPPGVRHVLLQRYMVMSMSNGKLSLLSFALLLFGIAHEAPLGPRLLAWAALGVSYAVRCWRLRLMLARLDPADPRSDRAYDVLVLLASSIWGIAPLLLQGSVSELNFYATLFAASVSLSLLAISYLAALPACVLLVSFSALPLITCLAMQGTLATSVLAFGVLMCGISLLQRVSGGHATLLQALASEAQNASLVKELQTYRRALESENAMLGSSLRDASHAASRDPLTNLFNRRYLAAFAEPLVEAVRQHREEVTVLLVDIDHFKAVNDRHGHPAGDEVLRAVGALLGTRLRDFDCLARWGGEEFLIVLRRCDIARGRRVAEALRHNVASAEIDTDSGIVPVTISTGVAQWSAGEGLDDLVYRADRALYRAKQSGRDRVELDATDALRLLGPSGDSTLPGHLH